MRTIPENKIIQSKGFGDTIGDITESFNLDLSSNYGAIRTNSTKMGSIVSGTLGLPVGFTKFQDDYYSVCNDYIYKGGKNPSESFDVVETETDIGEGISDIKVFNDNIYVSASTYLIYSSDGSTWTDTSEDLTSSPHLLEVLGDRLYITNNDNNVVSMNTSNVIATTGANTYTSGLSSEWVITTLRSNNSNLFIGYSNNLTGEGMVIVWDGETENTPINIINLPSGVVAGTIKDNVLYIIDTKGILKKYAGNDFLEVDKLFKKSPYYFDGSWASTNSRFIHPNGMQTTDDGTIMFLLSNKLENIDQYEDTIPSGIYEWDKEIGIYHKYSIGDTNCSGQQRIVNAGALCVIKPTQPDLAENGTILFGARYYTDATNTSYGIFYDDTQDTQEKCGYFITTWKMADIDDVWNKIYIIYKKLKNSISKFVVKYRTEEDEPTTATISWVDIDRFTTTTNVSNYVYGDEVIVLQGAGSGVSSHITSITENSGTYTVILDENYPTAVWGKTGKANFSKWKKAGVADYSEARQVKSFSLPFNNNQPFAQFKIVIKAIGKEELYKLKIINKNSIKE